MFSPMMVKKIDRGSHLMIITWLEGKCRKTYRSSLDSNGGEIVKSQSDSSDRDILCEFSPTQESVSQLCISKDKMKIRYSYPVNHPTESTLACILQQKPGLSHFAKSLCDHILSSLRMFMHQKFSSYAS